MRPQRTCTQFVALLLICVVALLRGDLIAADKKKVAKSPIVVGVITAVDNEARELTVKTKNAIHKLQLPDDSVVEYVGIADATAHKLTIGYGVKARLNDKNIIRTIRLTLPVPIAKAKPLGTERLKLSAEALFQQADKDDDKKVTYVEYSVAIFYSPKHGPDKFVKRDTNRDHTYNLKEFTKSLDDIGWWVLSRKTVAQWMKDADADGDQTLDIKEFAAICQSGSHIDNHFKRADRDSSDSLNLAETTKYIEGVTLGSSRSKNKKKTKRPVAE
jgi:Ca2+-binding EF-hand superfamily protein